LVHKIKANKLFLLAGMFALVGMVVFSSMMFSNRWENISTKLLYVINNSADVKGSFTGEWQKQGVTDGSIYLRYIWGKAGIEGVINHPLGFGYNSTGYGKYISDKYPGASAISSHSGWIDFALDNGILALILLLYLSVIIIYRGWQEFGYGNPIGLVLSLIVINYIGRCAIDGHLLGSRLTGFVLTVVILWVLMLAKLQRS